MLENAISIPIPMLTAHILAATRETRLAILVLLIIIPFMMYCEQLLLGYLVPLLIIALLPLYLDRLKSVRADQRVLKIGCDLGY